MRRKPLSAPASLASLLDEVELLRKGPPAISNASVSPASLWQQAAGAALARRALGLRQVGPHLEVTLESREWLETVAELGPALLERLRGLPGGESLRSLGLSCQGAPDRRRFSARVAAKEEPAGD